MAGHDGHGGTRNAKSFREKFNARLVGFAIYWRSGERNFQYTIELPRDGVLTGAGMNFDGDDCAMWCISNSRRAHGLRKTTFPFSFLSR